MNSFIEKIYSQKSLKEINHDLICLGKDTKYNSISFCKDRLITTAIIFILVFLFTSFGYITAPFLAIIYYYLFFK